MFDCKDSTIIDSVSHFDIDGDVISVERFGSGHINDTFCVKTDGLQGKSYLLQRINNHIFSDVEGLMSNTKIVLDHLKAKLAHLGDEAVEKGTLTLIPTKSGSLYFKDSENGYWRMFILLEGTKSYDIVETEAQAYSGGRAFGEFQKQLADLDARDLIEVLPNFHNIDFRMGNLREAMDADAAGRLQEVAAQLDFIFLREDGMRSILKRAAAGELPLRITHNDTKFNNVLLDQEDQVQCVIDLDTVMPGYVAYDFGDAIRTIINSAAEDEADTAKILLNIPLFKAYTAGYIREAKDFLNEAEIESLLEGVFLLPFMQAVRFLTDYLNGDTYYKIQYPGHNLVRTQAQLKLVAELEAHTPLLKRILLDSFETKN
ncbi:phosphotransferase enzyme family protein [Sphingobacterium bambusae]|uniref:Phosphotransferase enzyme family protein n=1 Tax=Sphingobacterium bambusae TaxID=662858 RepID=A0ABW6BKJ8_9SPHI|nr:aminoglycoside phosphotransferase family protein [Sphingobacterium bambusae]WPL49037.1 aminoglycoside phosphotransferase family protein [Sphingobacterium bambusae]